MPPWELLLFHSRMTAAYLFKSETEVSSPFGNADVTEESSLLKSWRNSIIDEDSTARMRALAASLTCWLQRYCRAPSAARTAASSTISAGQKNRCLRGLLIIL